MHQTSDFGRFFTHPVKLNPDTPRFHRAPTSEIEEPYRRSNSLVVRLSRARHRRGGNGRVFGWWINTNRNEEEALIAALLGHKVEDYDPENPYPRPDPEITDPYF
jgi:hypothetical protein